MLDSNFLKLLAVSGPAATLSAYILSTLYLDSFLTPFGARSYYFQPSIYTLCVFSAGPVALALAACMIYYLWALNMFARSRIVYYGLSVALIAIHGAQAFMSTYNSYALSQRFALSSFLLYMALPVMIAVLLFSLRPLIQRRKALDEEFIWTPVISRESTGGLLSLAIPIIYFNVLILRTMASFAGNVEIDWQLSQLEKLDKESPAVRLVFTDGGSTLIIKRDAIPQSVRGEAERQPRLWTSIDLGGDLGQIPLILLQRR